MTSYYSYDSGTACASGGATTTGDVYVTVPCNYEYVTDSITGDRIYAANDGNYIAIRNEISTTTTTVSYVSSIQYPENISYGSSIISSSFKEFRYWDIQRKALETYNYFLSGASYSEEAYRLLVNMKTGAMDPEWAKSVKRESLRQKIRNNLSQIGTCSNWLGRAANEEEERARKLLRSLIGEERYQMYLKRGFVVENGRTGMRYKVRPGHGMVEVLHPTKSGKFFKFRSLCIQPKVSGLPPTDAVIMRILLIRHDEFAMQKLSNVRVLATPSAEDERGVSELLKEKVA